MTLDKTTEKLIRHHWPKQMPAVLSVAEQADYRQQIKDLLVQSNACLVAHYYVDAQLQQLARETGGIVGDSLHIAEFGKQCDHDILVVCGVVFMAETVKILSPHKKVLMPTLEATCSLDLGCPVDKFKAFCQQHSDRTVVVYINTSAEVKACADWVVTSRIGLEVVSYLHSKGEKIIWAPDKHLGQYIQHQTQADMLSWDATCIVHDEFKAFLIVELKKKYPEAVLLAHPESPTAVLALADVIGSTAKLLSASKTMSQKTFIIATDEGIIAEMQRCSPDKEFIMAPTAGLGATCVSCGHCPWMAQNALQNLAETLIHQNNEVVLSDELISKASTPLQRMIDFKV